MQEVSEPAGGSDVEMAIGDIITAFFLGLLTPLTAVCVLPLYPAFLVYLSNKMDKGARRPLLLGLLVTFGAVLFMLLLGIVFTTIFQVSLTKVVGIISPIAFGILVLISLVLIFDIDISRFIPKFRAPTAKNPLLGAFIYGFFFGAIVVPCNPAFIAALLVRTVSVADYFLNILNFFSFGLGLGTPLLAFAIISQERTGKIINFLIKYKKVINRIAGIIMLAIALYYLLFVFQIFG